MWPALLEGGGGGFYEKEQGGKRHSFKCVFAFSCSFGQLKPGGLPLQDVVLPHWPCSTVAARSGLKMPTGAQLARDGLYGNGRQWIDQKDG